MKYQNAEKTSHYVAKMVHSSNINNNTPPHFLVHSLHQTHEVAPIFDGGDVSPKKYVGIVPRNILHLFTFQTPIIHI